MFVRALLLLLPVTLLVTGRLLADDDSSRAGKIDSLYSSLNAVSTPTDMGDPMMAEDSMLIKSFPENDQANVLAEIVERAAKTQKDVLVLGNALHLAQFILPDGKRRWNKKLEPVLLSLSDNTDPGIREYLVSIFLTHPDADHREVIIPLIYSLLGQEDDQMREGILDDVIKSKWPETKKICEDYVRTTQATEKYKESILVAKAYLNPADSDRAEAVLNKQNTPHAFEYYKSYIEAHKNDPNYAVSVNTALQAYNSIQGEVVFANHSMNTKILRMQLRIIQRLLRSMAV